MGNIFLAASSVLAQDESTTVALDDFQRGRNKKKQQAAAEASQYGYATEAPATTVPIPTTTPLFETVQPTPKPTKPTPKPTKNPYGGGETTKKPKTRQSTRPRLRKTKLKQRHGQAPAIRMAVVATRAPMAILIFTLSVSVPISPTCASISLVSQVPRSRYWRTKLLASVQLVSCSSQMKKKRAFTSSQSH